MNSLRKALCFLMAMMIAAIALPSLAAPQYSKQYSLTLTSSPAAPLTVVADLTNVALGPGNSNVGSFQYTFTGATIASVTTVPAIPPGTITISGSTVFVTGIAPLKAGKHFILTIVLNDCGDAITLPESGVQVWTGNMGQTFSPDTATANDFPLNTSVVCGNIACGDTNVTVPTSQPGSVTVTRDWYDKDGGTNADFCDTVPYTVTNTVASDGQLHFAWPIDNSGDPAAAFEYTVFNGGTPLTLIAWLNQDGSSANLPGTPEYIAALACNANANFLPTPYATLAANVVLGTDTTITVDTTAPTGLHPAIAHPAVPFDIVMGIEPDTERMTVTAVNDAVPTAAIWTVTRGVANVGPGIPHTAPLFVMSTPLPIMTITQGNINQYVAGDQAQGCIKAQGVDTTTFIDIGDLWGSQP